MSTTTYITLSCSIPKSEVNEAFVHHKIGGVVVEHGGDVLLGEGVGSVRDKQTCFTHRTFHVSEE